MKGLLFLLMFISIASFGQNGIILNTRGIPDDTTGLFHGNTPFYNYNTNTFQYQQPNNKEGYLGVIYQKKNPQAADFTAFGNTTVVNSGGRAYFSGGNGFNNGAILNAWGPTRLSRWRIYERFIDSVAGFGAGAGIKSINTWTQINFAGQLDLTIGNTANNIMYGGSNISSMTTIQSVNGTSGTVAGDTIEIVTEIYDDTASITCYNKTRNIYTKNKYRYNLWNPTLFEANTGYFTFFNFGGGQIMDSISITSTEIKNAQTCLITDSKGAFMLDSLVQFGFAQVINGYIPMSISWSRGSDRSTEALLALKEIYALSPKQVILPPFSNDLRSGMSQATSTSNYIALYDSLTMHGIKVIVAYPFYETSQDQSTQYSMIANNFRAGTIIDLWNPIKSNPTLYLNNGLSDGIHPNRYGIDTCVRRAVQQSILSGGIIQSLGYVQVSPILPQYGNVNMQGTGTFLNGLLLGSPNLGITGPLIKAQSATNIGFRLFQTINSEMGLGGFTDNAANSIPTIVIGSPLKFGFQLGSATYEFSRIDTVNGGMMYMGATSNDGSNAKLQISSPSAKPMSIKSTNVNGPTIQLLSNSTIVGTIGSGSQVVGGALTDFLYSSPATGKHFWAGLSGAFEMALDKGKLILGSTYSNNGSTFQLNGGETMNKDSAISTISPANYFLGIDSTTGRITKILSSPYVSVSQPDSFSFTLTKFNGGTTTIHLSTSGATPTLQQVLNSGYNLTKTDTIDVASNALYFTGTQPMFIQNGADIGDIYLNPLDVTSSMTISASTKYTYFRSNATSGNINFSMPAVNTLDGRVYVFTKTDASANTVTITPNASFSGKINGASSYVLSSQFSSVGIVATNGPDFTILFSH